MDAHRFDTLTRSLTGSSSRRRLLRGLAGAPLGLVLAHLPGVASANTRKKAKKPNLNAFGCLDVGAACGGNDDLCCSGICQGKKPKQGKKDRRTCVGHNMGGCTPARSFCVVGETVSKCGDAGADARCLTTTGHAGFCAHFETFSAANCLACNKDTDCETLGYPPGSACVIYDGGMVCSGKGSCKVRGSSKGTACVPAGV